jgi:hypothetical protein
MNKNNIKDTIIKFIKMIIGICGFKSSGKDTIADYLIKEYSFKKLSFASTLKDIISIMFGWSRDKLEGITKEDREWREKIDPWWSKTLKMPLLSPRYVMQYFGTDLFRNHFHSDIWVKIVENKLNKYLEEDNIVITDCRFNNEINMILQLGGKIIQVHRNLPSWFNKYKEGEYPIEVKSIHCTEIEWIRCYKDYDIKNDGTIKELEEKVKYILEKLLKDNLSI